MLKQIKKYLIVISALTVVCLVLQSNRVVFAAGKISSSPSSVSVDEGYGQKVQIQLDAPIICSGMGTCQVSLSFHSNDPTVTSPNPVVFKSTEWASVKTLIINTANDNSSTGDKHVTLTAKAVSASEYYSNYQINIPVTVIDSGKASLLTINSPSNGAAFVGSSITASGTGPVGDSVYANVDNDETGTTVIDSSGNWTIRISGLSSGNHTFSANTTPPHAYAYLNNQYTDEIDIMDTATHQFAATGVGSGGTDVVYNPANNRIYTASDGKGGSRVFVLDGNDGSFIDDIQTTVSGTPVSVALGADRHKVYILYYDGDPPDLTYHIDVLNVADDTISSTFDLTTNSGDTLSGMQVSPYGNELWVRAGNYIKVIQISNPSSFTTISLSDQTWEQHNLIFSQDGAKVYTAGSDAGVVHSINTTSHVVSDISVGGGAYNLGLTPDGSKLYVTSYGPFIGIETIDTSNNTLIDSQTTEFPPESIAFTEDGQFIAGDDHTSGQIYFGNTGSNALVLDTVIFNLGGSYANYNNAFISTAAQRSGSLSVGFTLGAFTSITAPNTGYGQPVSNGYLAKSLGLIVTSLVCIGLAIYRQKPSNN